MGVEGVMETQILTIQLTLSQPGVLVFSKKATKIDKIFTVDLTVTTYCQTDGEDFVNFCGLLRKREL